MKWGASRFQVVPYRIPRRCAATYYPETNVLMPVRSVVDKSNQPVPSRSGSVSSRHCRSLLRQRG